MLLRAPNLFQIVSGGGDRPPPRIHRIMLCPIVSTEIYAGYEIGVGSNGIKVFRYQVYKSYLLKYPFPVLSSSKGIKYDIRFYREKRNIFIPELSNARFAIFSSSSSI